MRSMASCGLLRIMSVSTGPGAIALTRMPSRRVLGGHRSGERHQRRLVRRIDGRTRREVECTDGHQVDHCGVRADFSRCGNAACTRKSGPRTFTSYDFASASAVISPRGCARALAALLTTTSMPPNSSTVFCTRASSASDVSEVGRYADRLAAEFAQVLRGLLAGVCLAARDRDAGTGEDKSLGECEADAAGATRHDDGASGHVEQAIKCCAVHAVSQTDRDVDATYCATV